MPLPTHSICRSKSHSYQGVEKYMPSLDGRSGKVILQNGGNKGGRKNHCGHLYHWNYHAKVSVRIDNKDTFRHKISQKLIFSQEATRECIYKNWEHRSKKNKASDLGTRGSHSRKKQRKPWGGYGRESPSQTGAGKTEDSQRRISEKDLSGGSRALRNYLTVLKESRKKKKATGKKLRQIFNFRKNKKLSKKGRVIMCSTGTQKRTILT